MRKVGLEKATEKTGYRQRNSRGGEESLWPTDLLLSYCHTFFVLLAWFQLSTLNMKPLRLISILVILSRIIVVSLCGLDHFFYLMCLQHTGNDYEDSIVFNMLQMSPMRSNGAQEEEVPYLSYDKSSCGGMFKSP